MEKVKGLLGARARAYLELMKPFHSSKSTLYYGFCVFVGGLSASSCNLRLMDLLKAIVAVTMSAFAIYTLNDICDIEIDRINTPERPLPSQRVTVREAEVLTALLFTLSIMIAYEVNLTALFFTMLFSFLGIAYSIPPIRLKDGFFSDVCWGLGIGAAILCGASITIITSHSIIAASIMIFLTVGCGFTKDLKDLEGDKACGIRTLPIALGEENAIKLMTAAAAAGFPLFIFYSFKPLYLAIIAVTIIMFVYSLLLLNKNSGSKMTYKKAYKIQSGAGFLIIIAFITCSLT